MRRFMSQLLFSMHFWVLSSSMAAVPASTPTVLQISSAGQHSCALLVGPTIKCWGGNDSGQLGQGDTKARGERSGTMGTKLLPVDLGRGHTAVAVKVGSQHSCAILSNRTLKCWGNNDDGELGIGDQYARGDQPGSMGDALPAVDLGAGRYPTALALGAAFTCALLDNQSVKCWGLNQYGQLGLGDRQSRGTAMEQMGHALPAVDLGAGRKAVAIAAGDKMACALLAGGLVKCWGNNANGELGQGDDRDRGRNVGDMGESLRPVDLAGHKARYLTAARESVCVGLDDDSVRCWGANHDGILGISADHLGRGQSPTDMGASLSPVTLVAPGLLLKGLQCGNDHCCALFANHALKCWGSNNHGELGIGSNEPRGSDAMLMGDALPFVSLGPLAAVNAVALGNEFSCALLSNGDVKCWGLGDDGQLGNERRKDLGSSPGSMGRALQAIPL